QQLIYPDDRQKVKEAVAGGQYDIIYRMITRFGEIKWIRENGQVVSYDNSGTDYVDGILLDITELKQTQQQLEQSLSEKDTLLKETHHRVKNNLFVVVSLLEMQAMRSHDPRVHAILQQSVDRVHAMALVHEKLYRSQSLDQIDFAPYLENLVLDLLHSYGAHDNNIKINIEADNEALVLDQAIPCGLIINELISNSLQHAFDENGGEINLEFKLDESEETKYRLLVEDNGSGFPENFDLQESDSLGLQLVSSLAQNQLNGEFEMLNTDNGAAFEIKF
ncbi:MAG: sensor histidine kinase, partial [bacterium]